MLKNISQLKVSIDGKDHTYLCENDSQLSHVKEALFQFLKYVGQIEDQVKAQQEKVSLDEKLASESVETPEIA